MAWSSSMHRRRFRRAASAGVTSSGLITSKLQQLLDMDEAAALLDKAGAVVAGYRRPGG